MRKIDLSHKDFIKMRWVMTVSKAYFRLPSFRVALGFGTYLASTSSDWILGKGLNVKAIRNAPIPIPQAPT